MRYYTVLMDGEEKVATSVDGKSLYVLDGFNDMDALIAAGGVRAIPKDANKINAEMVKLLSPIPRPRQDVLCLGINYTAHAEEAERFSKESFGGERPYPIFFSKRVCYSQGTDAPIPAYTGLVDSLDYECELGVVIGKDAKNVKREDVPDYIFGYTIVNDVSARNLQTRHKQWYFGKSLDGFTPMGPCIVSAVHAHGSLHRVRRRVRVSTETADCLPGKRGSAAGFQHGEPDHRHHGYHRHAERGHDPESRNGHRYRYPGGRRNGHEAACILKTRRCGGV